MSDAALGALILVPLVVVIYVVARVVSGVGDAWGARLLAPLAPAIGGEVSRTGPNVTGTHRGLPVRISFTTNQPIGTGDVAYRINAFHVEVLDVTGSSSWQIAFSASMWTSLAKDLLATSPDAALAERLNGSGALDLIAGVNVASYSYVVAAYDARTKVLTYTDDVSPRRVPKADHFARELDLVARLAAINGACNPVHA